MSSSDQEQTHFMQLALEEAAKCVPTPTAFCVGCVITVRLPTESSSKPSILTTGYSRELAGNTHAEANALSKAYSLSQADLNALFPSSRPTIDELLTHADVYTTLEPCSVRTSGLAPCAEALIAARIRRCFIGVAEPDDFVTCEGTQKLRHAGVEVVYIKGLEADCLNAARRGHSQE